MANLLLTYGELAVTKAKLSVFSRVQAAKDAVDSRVQGAKAAVEGAKKQVSGE